jgi:hypothetical protein
LARKVALDSKHLGASFFELIITHQFQNASRILPKFPQNFHNY